VVPGARMAPIRICDPALTLTQSIVGFLQAKPKLSCSIPVRTVEEMHMPSRSICENTLPGIVAAASRVLALLLIRPSLFDWFASLLLCMQSSTGPALPVRKSHTAGSACVA
jgi:hypothetical protein